MVQIKMQKLKFDNTKMFLILCFEKHIQPIKLIDIGDSFYKTRMKQLHLICMCRSQATS